MTHPPTQSWYPSHHDIQPNPNSPFTTPAILIIALTPQEQQLKQISKKLQYIEEAKQKITNDRWEKSRQLDVARTKLSEKGADGRDGRDRMRNVVVLEKSLVVHDSYLKDLEVCEEQLRRNEREVKGLVWEGGDVGGGGGDGRGWWVEEGVEGMEGVELQSGDVVMGFGGGGVDGDGDRED